MLGGNTMVSRLLSLGASLPNATCAVGLVWPCKVITCATSQTRCAGAPAPSQRSTQSPKLAVVRSGVEGTAAGEFAVALEVSLDVSFGICAPATIGTRHRTRTHARVIRIMN